MAETEGPKIKSPLLRLFEEAKNKGKTQPVAAETASQNIPQEERTVQVNIPLESAHVPLKQVKDMGGEKSTAQATDDTPQLKKDEKAPDEPKESTLITNQPEKPLSNDLKNDIQELSKIYNDLHNHINHYLPDSDEWSRTYNELFEQYEEIFHFVSGTDWEFPWVYQYSSVNIKGPDVNYLILFPPAQREVVDDEWEGEAKVNEFFNYDNDQSEIYEEIDGKKTLKTFPQFQLIEPAVFTVDEAKKEMILIKKGLLHLGESPPDQKPEEPSEQNIPGVDSEDDADDMFQTPPQVSTETEDEKRNREEGEQEKEKEITTLQAFYQEQGKETIDHKFIERLIEDKRKLLQEALDEDIYINVFPDEKDFKNVIIQSTWGYFEEIRIGRLSSDNEKIKLSFTNEYFIQELNEKIGNIADAQEKQKLTNFKDKFIRNEDSLYEYREKIIRTIKDNAEKLLTFEEFASFAPPLKIEEKLDFIDSGLYSQDSYAYIETGEGEEKKNICFTLDKNADNNEIFLDLLNKAKKRLGITESETHGFPKSEDPHAVRGGEGEYNLLKTDYTDFKELEETYHKKWFLKDKKILKRMNEMKVQIVLREFFSVKSLFSDSDYTSAKNFFENQSKERRNWDFHEIKNFLDKNKSQLNFEKISKYSQKYITYIEIAVLLHKRNYALLKGQSDMAADIEDNKLPQVMSRLAGLLGKSKEEVSMDKIKKLYLTFEKQPKPATTPSQVKETPSKPQETPVKPAVESKSDTEGEKKEQALKRGIELMWNKIEEAVKKDNPYIANDDKIQQLIDIKMENFTRSFCAKLELNLDDQALEALLKEIKEKIQS